MIIKKNNNNSNNNNNNNNNNGKHIVNTSKLIRNSYKYCFPDCTFCEKSAFQLCVSTC